MFSRNIIYVVIFWNYLIVKLHRLLILNMLNCFKYYKRCIHISYHILGVCSTEEDQIHYGVTLHVAYPILSRVQDHARWCPGDIMSQGIDRHWYWPNNPEFSISSIWRVNIYSSGTQQSARLTQSTSWLMMAWRQQSPGHLLPWYWSKFP